MSMLAERKQKTSWILDPRQNDWSRDSNKFGQKMLEKMGWTPGKGLGASEQGMTEALRIKYKSDSKGLGCKEPKYEWLKQQQEFDNFLSTFHDQKESEEDQQKRISLEEKSKQTKKRVFYHKSIKGKDVTRYSEKDLRCIIGFANNNQPGPDENEDLNQEKSEQSQNEKKTENEVVEIITEKKKKKKKKKKTLAEIESNEVNDIELINETTEISSADVIIKKKKKKKKETSEESQATTETNEIKEVELDDTTADVKLKKKKKKRKTNEETQDATEIEAQQVLSNNDDLTVPKKKRRKNKD